MMIWIAIVIEIIMHDWQDFAVLLVLQLVNGTLGWYVVLLLLLLVLLVLLVVVLLLLLVLVVVLPAAAADADAHGRCPLIRC